MNDNNEYETLSFEDLLVKGLDSRIDTAPLLAEAQRRDLSMTEELAAVVGKVVGEEWTPVGNISLDDGTYQISVCIRQTPKAEPPQSEFFRSMPTEQAFPNHKLGVYFAPTHGRQSDKDYIAALQPPVIRLLDPDVQQISDMHKLSPNAVIVARTWVIDDNNGEAVRALMADPVGTGLKHAAQYREQLERWSVDANRREIPFPTSDQLYFNAANEPNQGGTPDKIAAYNIAFLNRCTELGVRACALCLGVGWPDNSGPDTPVNWTPYQGVVEPIQRGNHWLELHEYCYKTGPQDGWRWLCGRHLQCPFDVPILLGEIGIDNFVDAARWHREGGNRGWKGNVSPDAYADMIELHIRGSDTRVVAALPFITDYRDRGWESFDTSDAHNALLARKEKMVPQTPFSGSGTAPDISVMYVHATAGANLRARPIDGDILIAVPYGHAVQVHGTDGGSWSNVTYKAHNGWILTMLLSHDPEPPVLQPPVVTPPSSIADWDRSIAFVLKEEGGFQNNPADTGNYYQGRLIGTKYGISAATWGGQYDIPNITVDQAKTIYHQHYWLSSDAYKYPFPLSLLILDTAVLHGVGTAKTWLKEVGPDPYLFAAKRLRAYTVFANWPTFGIGWVRRVASLLEEIGGKR